MDISKVTTALLFAFAAIGAVASAVQVVQWLRSPAARLVANVRVGEYRLQPTVPELLRRLQRTRWHEFAREVAVKDRLKLTEQSRAVAEIAVSEIGDALEQKMNVYDELVYPSSLSSYWHVEVTNKGQSKATGVSIYHPAAPIVQVTVQGSTTRILPTGEMRDGRTIPVGDLPPGHSASIYIWSPLLASEFSLQGVTVTHDAGQAEISPAILLGGWYYTFYAWRHVFSGLSFLVYSILAIVGVNIVIEAVRWAYRMFQVSGR